MKQITPFLIPDSGFLIPQSRKRLRFGKAESGIRIQESGFALMEILLAIALFAMVAAGMVSALNGIAQTTTAARQEAQVLRVLESVLAEVTHLPEFKTTKYQFPKTGDNIDASVSIEKVRLFTKDKLELDHMFRIHAEAWISDGLSARRMIRSMQTYVYSPNSPI